MPRMRTIKPGFFTNDLLAEVPMAGRLLFAGLWCIADRAGRLEDRPRKIKAEVMPYDDCDVDALLAELAARDFIQRYEVDGQHYIQVVNFSRHQNPHMKEAPSTIPTQGSHDAPTPDDEPQEVPAPYEHSESTVQEPEKHTKSRAGISHGVLAMSHGNLGLSHGEDVPEPAAAAAVARLHELLTGQAGYEPSEDFLVKVAKNYGHLDLEEEAIKMVGWLLNNRKQRCTTAFVLNWLRRTAEAFREREQANGAVKAHSNGTPTIGRLTDDQKRAKGIIHG